MNPPARLVVSRRRTAGDHGSLAADRLASRRPLGTDDGSLAAGCVESRRRPARDDGGFAMITAVIVSALIVAITGALVLSLTSGGRESARQRELYEARAAGVSALEYLYARLGTDPDFFDDMLAQTAPVAPPSWIDHSSAGAPDAATDGDWNQFGSALAIEECDTRLDPCWEMRFAGDGSRTPTDVDVEAVVRFDCRGRGYCSVRRFQQRMRRTNETGHAWQRSDLTEVASGAALPTVALLPDAAEDASGLQTSSISVDGITLTWTAPTEAPDGYHVQWKSGSEDYPSRTSDPRHQDVTNATYAMTGLTAGTAYTVRVRSYNTGGNSDWTESVFATLPNAPSSLQSDTRTVATDDNAIELKWTAPTGGPATTSYLVQWKSGTESYETTGARTATATSSPYEVTGLDDGTYNFQVRAQSAGGLGAPSNELTSTFP